MASTMANEQQNGDSKEERVDASEQSEYDKGVEEMTQKEGNDESEGAEKSESIKETEREEEVKKKVEKELQVLIMMNGRKSARQRVVEPPTYKPKVPEPIQVGS